MKLPKELITITKFSKGLAMFLFVALPFIGFLVGMNYQYLLDSVTLNNSQIIPLAKNPLLTTSPMPTNTNSGLVKPKQQTELTPLPTITIVKATLIPTSTPTPMPAPAITYGKADQEGTLVIKGNVYSDDNCNFLKDWNEQSLSGVEVNILRIPEYTLLTKQITDANGNYSYSMTRVDKNPSITLKVAPVSPSGYELANAIANNKTYATVTLNADQSSVFVYFPELPYKSMYSCR